MDTTKSSKVEATQSSLEELVKTSFVTDQGDGNVLVEKSGAPAKTVESLLFVRR